MGYCIMRTAKLKSMGNIAGSAAHAFRDIETPNADPQMTPKNHHFGAGSKAELLQKIKARLPEKRRSDAVLCIEHLFTASPDTMAAMTPRQQGEYFKRCGEWLKEHYGAKNLVYMGIHLDEKTPHAYAYVIPLDPDTGRLNAKRWTGSRKLLSDMQTSFHENVGAKFDMERGLKGSKAKHVTRKQYYASLEQAMSATPPERPSKGELAQAAVGFKSPALEQLLAAAAQVPVMAAEVQRSKSLYQKLQKQAAHLDRLQANIDETTEKFGDLAEQRRRIGMGLERLSEQSKRIEASESYAESLKTALRGAESAREAIKNEFNAYRAEMDQKIWDLEHGNNSQNNLKM